MAGPAKFWIGLILVAVAAAVVLREDPAVRETPATPAPAEVSAGSTAGGGHAPAGASPAPAQAPSASSAVLDSISIDEAVSTAQAQAPAVAIFYSIADSTSRQTMSRIGRLASEGSASVTFLGFAIDVETQEKLSTFLRETGAGFSSQTLGRWERGEPQAAIRRLGTSIRDPWVLPFVVVVDERGGAIASWEGLRTVELLEGVLSGAGWMVGEQGWPE
jgi:hypothetical protein